MDFKFRKTLLTKLNVLNKSSLFSYYSIKCLVFDQQGIKGITTNSKREFQTRARACRGSLMMRVNRRLYSGFWNPENASLLLPLGADC